MPSAVYFDLATWHLINTVYNPLRVAELRGMRSFYADPAHHRRLMSVIDQRLGHDLLARAEAAKIAVAEGGATTIGLEPVESGLRASFDEAGARAALDADLDRIVAAARETAAVRPGLRPDEIDALYFTGGSTGLRLLTDRLQQAFPRGAAGARRPLRQRRQRPGAACGAALRQVAERVALSRRAPPPSPGRWPRRCRVFRPATHSRPERTR